MERRGVYSWTRAAHDVADGVVVHVLGDRAAVDRDAVVDAAGERHVDAPPHTARVGSGTRCRCRACCCGAASSGRRRPLRHL